MSATSAIATTTATATTTTAAWTSRFDNCPTVYNPDQADADKDGLGTACDSEEPLPPSAPPPPDAGPGARVADTHAPRLALRIARRLARDDGPFVVPISCNEGCALEASLEVDARTARRLRIGSRKVVLAKGSWALGGAARTYVFCDWQRAGKRALKHKRAFTARVMVTARDLAGNLATARKTVTLAAPPREPRSGHRRARRRTPVRPGVCLDAANAGGRIAARASWPSSTSTGREHATHTHACRAGGVPAHRCAGAGRPWPPSGQPTSGFRGRAWRGACGRVSPVARR